MIRYTTPVVEIRVKGIDLTDGYRVWVSLKQESNVQTTEVSGLTLDGSDTIIEFKLSQEQTANLKASAPMVIQVNFIDRDGNRNATNQVSTNVSGNLLNRIVTYE